MAQVCSSGNCDAGECVDLTTRESSVCQIICGAQEPISFTKVKDSSNLHQEIVSRIVRRLVIHGLVSKEEGKFRTLQVD
jgi:predicted transcriptional regulator